MAASDWQAQDFEWAGTFVFVVKRPRTKPPFRGFPVFVGSVSGAYKEKKLFLPPRLVKARTHRFSKGAVHVE